MSVNITIPGDPVPKGRPRMYRGRAVTPRQTKIAEDVIRWRLAAAKVRPAAGDVRLDLVFRLSHRRRIDCDNLVKLVMDAGNGFAWVDDAQVVELHAYVERGSPSPGTDLKVTQQEEVAA